MAKIGIELLGFGQDYAALRDITLKAEALGFDSIWHADNIIWKDHQTGEYDPIFEAWTLLSALTEATSRIRLGSLVSPARRRHPALLTKMVSTIDRIGNGRIDLGLGTGDVESHLEVWGISLPPVRERIAILREEIHIMKRLWTEYEVTYEGDYYNLNQANNNPPPVQNPHPPIWLGIVLGRTLMPKLAAELADGVVIYNASDIAAKQHLDNVARYCDKVGRDFREIEMARSIFVSISKNEKDLPQVEMDLTATLEEQGRQVKGSADSYNEYKKVTQRHVIGTPSQVAEQLIDMVGSGYENLILIGINDTPSLELFAAEVLPEIHGI